MAVRIKDFFRNLTSGAGISGRTVLLKKHSDDTQIASTTTAADGSFSFSDSDFTYRGPTYYEVDDGTRFKEHSSKSLGQVGPVWFTDIIRAFDGMGPGVINGLAVSAGLGNMNLSIAAGSAILKDGILHGDDSARTLTVTTADATNPRIDTVVLRVTRIGQTDEGDRSLVLLAGTAAASPTAPSVTQTSATWDLPLADVLVDAGVSSIASGKVTDRRSYAVRLLPPPGNNGDLMTVSSGQWVPVAPGAAAATFTVNSNGTPVSSSINTTDYSSAFSVSNSPSNQVNIGIATAGISNAMLSNGSVTSAKLATDSVLTTRIADSNVTTAKIADGNVTTAKIADANVTTAKIANSAVNSAQIAVGAVGASQIGTNAITVGKIMDGQVTIAKIAAASIGTGSGKLAASDHTHILTDSTFAQAIAGYTFHSVGTSIGTVANQNTGTLASGKRYFVYARADGQGNAPSGGYIQMYVRIEAGGTNTAGTTTGVVSGERPIWAQDAKIVTGTGTTINVAARAGTDTGTGSITDASVHCIVIPLDVPAS